MEKLTDVEFLNVSGISPGEVIFLYKHRPSGEYLMCKHCKNNCHLNEKGYGHPVAVVEVRNLQDERIEISFVQVSPFPFEHQASCIHINLDDHNAVWREESNSILLT
jgi:hypothetical protein